MQELNLKEIESVSGANAGAVASCLSVGGFGARLGSSFGPWGMIVGGSLGCGVGVSLYLYANP